MRPTTLDAAVSRAASAAGPYSAGETWVVALSGGADSVALLDAAVRWSARTGVRVLAAHLDHGLRATSPEDAAFCARLCADLGVAFRSGQADVRRRLSQDGGGLEEAARLERRSFLETVRTAEQARFVLVAHTRDDQAETVLLRLLRGAGSRGLAAMRARSGHVLRPLLEVSRACVIAHLRARGLAWREDESNRDLAILRNRVRHELLPYLESRFNPAIRDTLARTAAVLGEESDVLDSVPVPGCTRRADGSVSLSLSALRGAAPGIARLAVRRALEETGGLRAVRLGHVDRIVALAATAAPSGRRVALPGGREAAFHFDELRIGPAAAARRPSFAMAFSVPGRAELPDGSALLAEPAAAGDAGEPPVLTLPAGALEVRTRRPGDRVRANGREVSLRRFLVEQRVPAAQRAALPLVACGDQVLWVAGQVVEGPSQGARRARLRLVAPATRTP